MNKTEDNFQVPYGKENLIRVQNRLLEIFKEIDAIFRANNIRYFLFYGTLLGAVRHAGFIPWDDDLDIAVMKDDYEQAIELLRQQLPDKYIVHDKKTDPIYWCEFSKIRDKNSSTVSNIWIRGNKLKYRGISIDIYRCWEQPCSKFLKRKNKNAEKTKFAMMAFVTTKNIKKLKIGFNFLFFVSKYLFYRILDKFASKSPKYVCDPYDFSTPLEKEYFFPLQETKFEDVVTYIPKHSKEILTEIYGDFMTPPPPEQRKLHASSIEFFD